jgi:hypothetical protein
MAGVHELVTGPGGTPDNAMYFWLTGGLSSFLDNAPTYLVFFNTAGGDPAILVRLEPGQDLHAERRGAGHRLAGVCHRLVGDHLDHRAAQRLAAGEV